MGMFMKIKVIVIFPTLEDLERQKTLTYFRSTCINYIMMKGLLGKPFSLVTCTIRKPILY